MKTIILIILFIVICSSCITYSQNNRSSLSDAMEAAKDDNDHSVPSNKENDDNWFTQDDEDNSESVELNFENLEPIDLIVSLRYGQTTISTPYFESSKSMEVLIGGNNYNNKISSYLFGGFDLLQVSKDHDIYNSIKHEPFQLYGGLELRYYPLKINKYFSPYILGRLGGTLLAWEFKNPIASGSETIENDILGGVLADIGIGIDIITTDRIKLGVVCMPQSNLYGPTTYEGFTNDYFSANGDITIALEVGYLF